MLKVFALHKRDRTVCARGRLIDLQLDRFTIDLQVTDFRLNDARVRNQLGTLYKNVTRS